MVHRKSTSLAFFKKHSAENIIVKSKKIIPVKIVKKVTTVNVPGLDLFDTEVAFYDLVSKQD